jgi:hypothetical protein
MSREIPFDTALRSMKVFVNLRGNFEDKECWAVVYDFIKLHADLSADPILPTPKIKHTPLPKPPESTPKNIHRNAPNGHIWLNVPFERKDFAKSYGARWNPQEKKWYFDGILPVELDQFLPNQSSIQTPITTKKVKRIEFDWRTIDEALNGKETTKKFEPILLGGSDSKQSKKAAT